MSFQLSINKTTERTIYFMKKTLCVILAVIMTMMSFCIVSSAEEDVNYDDLVSPCFDNIFMISAGITEKALGFVNCFSDYITYETDKTFVLTCYLQRTDGSSAWATYKSKSETFTGKGSNEIEKNWYAPAGYSYRVLTKLVVKNSAGTIVETATVASGVIYK